MKKPKLLWLQAITCNGNVHSFFNHPQFLDLISRYEVVYHPMLESSCKLEDVFARNASCDVLILEGAIAKQEDELVLHYAKGASLIVTAGTCATYGGVFRQKDPRQIGGFLFDNQNITERHEAFCQKTVSIPGCPLHPQWLGFVLESFLLRRPIEKDRFLRPKELFGYTVHEGCVRNEYFEWKIDAKGFGQKEGCLFYEQGCQGPHTRAPCNKILWHEVSSKTRAGTPCLGCTQADFPTGDFFQTPKHMGIPARLPLEVPKRAYLTMTGMAKSFHVERLERKLIDYE